MDMSRNEIELKMVSTMKKVLAQPRKKGAFALEANRAKYFAAMDKMGFDGMQAYHGWHDVLDIAQLELEAA